MKFQDIGFSITFNKYYIIDPGENMRANILYIQIPVIIIFLILIPWNSISGKKDFPLTPNEQSWNKQLAEMNYLIMRTSAANIINGLWLSKNQLKDLKKICKKLEGITPPTPEMNGDTNKELIEIRKTYLDLLKYLIKNRTIPVPLRNKVTEMRLLESEIIKRSVAGAQSPGYNASGCLGCHAPPSHFPKGDISSIRTKKITRVMRKRIDMAHVIGLYGQQGTHKLWKLRSEVDKLVNNNQKFILKKFKCCLVPPEGLSDPTNIGQAFVSDKWIKYFADIRNIPKKTWPDVKQLYIIPIEDIIESKLPGIRKKDKKGILKKVNLIIEKSRKMDNIDFELKKKSLCLDLSNALNIDFLIRESKQEKDERQFLGAMFLLLPGNLSIYNEVLRNVKH